ncbi:unnamed protein product [Oreochromis niloticus]|nr:unnamed protein product [Mustela putorius furo]
MIGIKQNIEVFQAQKLAIEDKLKTRLMAKGGEITVKKEVDKKMALSMAHTMARVRRRQLTADIASEKLEAMQKAKAVKKASREADLEKAYAEKTAREFKARCLEEEKLRAEMLKALDEGRKNAIRLKEKKRQNEQVREQKWDEFNRKCYIEYVLSEKKKSEEKREQNIKVSKFNFAIGEEKRARAYLEIQKQKERYEHDKRVQKEVDKKMALSMAHTMARVRRRQLTADIASEKLEAMQKAEAVKKALREAELEKAYAEKEAREFKARCLEEEQMRAEILKAIDEGRKNAIRLKEKKRQEEQVREQKWDEFNRKCYTEYVLSEKEKSKEKREQNIKVSKFNFAIGEEKRARAYLEKIPQKGNPSPDSGSYISTCCC